MLRDKIDLVNYNNKKKRAKYPPSQITVDVTVILKLYLSDPGPCAGASRPAAVAVTQQHYRDLACIVTRDLATSSFTMGVVGQHRTLHSLFLVPAGLLWLSIMSEASEYSCTTEALTGIVQGGGKGMLDLDKVTGSLGGLNADEGTAPIFANADCSSGLETPIAMRTLLGETL